MSVNVRELLEKKCCNNIAACTDEEIYYGLLGLVKELAKEKESSKGKKKIYYISAEFLIGKLLSNNLINLGIYDEVADMLKQYGKDIMSSAEAFIISSMPPKRSHKSFAPF